VTSPIPVRAILTLPAKPQHVGRARDFVGITLGNDHPCAEALTLIVSELVTNSILHSRSRHNGGNIVITLRCPPGGGLGMEHHIRVEVADDGESGLPSLRPVGTGDVRGRGLHLVDALADAWDCARDPAGSTTTWAEVIA
jgi:anti-sigma regulatory factor (Ser/Thr protein kinase)